MSKAILWKPLKDGKVQCRACSHFCSISPGDKGICGVRQNREGELFTLVRDRVAALNVDPIEKKPLFHFMPGSRSLSLGTMGCNMDCAFCQNSTLSQTPKQGKEPEGRSVPPESLVSMALEHEAESISYTYSEPTVFIELTMDTAKAARDKGLKNVIVSNGFESPECLQEMDPFIDAANIDLKAFTADFYRDYCQARLNPVLRNLVEIKRMGWWLEVTTLIITGLNDSEEEIRDMAGFISKELGRDTPWHISRFHPAYKMMDRPSTPVSTIELAFNIGKEAGLDYVYPGNVPGHPFESTYCPECKKKIISRTGFALQELNLQNGACAFCSRQIPGFWKS